MRRRRPASPLALAALLLALVVAASAGALGCGGEEVIEVEGDPRAGERIVDADGQEIAPNCGLCHTMEAAEWEGATAPNLDRLEVGYQRVFEAVRDGPGAMPSYSDQLDERQIHDVAAYVSSVAGRADAEPAGTELEEEGEDG
jgi:mono/diheme cytochrome c family protein